MKVNGIPSANFDVEYGSPMEGKQDAMNLLSDSGFAFLGCICVWILLSHLTYCIRTRINVYIIYKTVSIPYRPKHVTTPWRNMGLSKAHPIIDSECQVRELPGCYWVGMFIICMCIPRNTQPVAMVSLWTGPLWFCSDWKWAYLKDLWDTWCLEIDGLLLQSKIIIAIVPWFFWFHFRAVVGTLCMSGNVGTLGSSH